MSNMYPFILVFIIALNLAANGQNSLPGQDPFNELRGSAILTMDRIEYLVEKMVKDAEERPFHIEAVYDVSDCSISLTSIQLNNAHFPITWYELNEAGNRIHVLFNPQLNHFNNHTTYVVEDFSQNTDTITIEFSQSLAIDRIYPNPHRGVLYIDYSAIDPTEMKILIFDSSGKRISEQTRILAEGENQMIFDMINLEQGVYFLLLTGVCINELRKIIHLE